MNEDKKVYFFRPGVDAQNMPKRTSKKPIQMTTCQNCKSIQQVGKICGICRCRVETKEESWKRN